MTVFVSLFLLIHMLAIGAVVERWPRFFRARVFIGVFAYFVVAFIAFGLLLRTFPGWIDPRL